MYLQIRLLCQLCALFLSYSKVSIAVAVNIKSQFHLPPRDAIFSILRSKYTVLECTGMASLAFSRSISIVLKSFNGGGS